MAAPVLLLPALKAAIAAHPGWAALIGGQLATQFWGQWSERDMARAMMEMQRKQGLAEAEGTKRAVLANQAASEKMLNMMLGLRREERGEAREQRSLERWLSNRENQTAIIMALMQALQGAARKPEPVMRPPPTTILGLLKGAYNG